MDAHRTPEPPRPTIASGFPTLEDLRGMQPRVVAPVTYTGRNGMEVKWETNGYEYDFNVNGKQLTIFVSVETKPNEPLGAVVFRNGLRHSPQAVVEFARTSDFSTSRLLASVIKENGKVVRRDDDPPAGYDQLRRGAYADVVRIKYAKDGQCVLAREDDIPSMAFHGLLRCRQRGDI